MKKPIQLSIPNPCHENWANMTPAEKGRFCAACQKTVRDFTQASDREIVEAVQSGSSACGRFRASQLNRELIVRKDKSPFWTAASAAAITFLTIGTGEFVAQTPVNTEHHENKTDDIKQPISAEGKKTVTGTVLDLQEMPIPGVTVKVRGSNAPAVQTDFDGQFAIECTPEDILEFTYIGMETQTLKIGSGVSCVITMADGASLEDIFVGSYYWVDYNISHVKEFKLNP